MQRKKFVDEYFNKQPSRTFVDDLRTREVRLIQSIDDEKSGYVMVQNAFLNISQFNVPSLKTAYDAFDVFLRDNNRAGECFSFVFRKDENLATSDYKLKTMSNTCLISAFDEDGIRRATVRLMDDILAQGGLLKKGLTHGKCKIKDRVTRCYFSPTNRPPKNGDELLDNIDYYPENYLERLSYNGITAIWIYTDFNSLFTSSHIKEFGKDGEKRLEKLNKVIDKCEKYGIGVYLFMIEPMSLTNNSIASKVGNIVECYPQTHGNTLDGEIAFCTRTAFAKEYLKEMVVKLLEKLPKLKGWINIPQGERITACSTVWMRHDGTWLNSCSRCSKYSKAENLAYTVNLVREYMRKKKPSFEYVSFTYEHRLWGKPELEEYFEQAPTDVVWLQNFEDDSRVKQLGKVRQAIDYWLSVVGPSEKFYLTAKKASERGARVWAKMQVACSHELATVPYIPVPGIIYDKIAMAQRLGVSGIMESWYFGNYPCIMSKAVALLSYSHEFRNKKEFLRYLARLYYPVCDTEYIVTAWKLFERAYKNYPVNTMFSYYGPAHDGIVWELALKPKNFSLPRSWQLIDRPDGDRIGECSFNGHTTKELVTLLKRASNIWEKGLKILVNTSIYVADTDMVSVAKAIALLFDSAKNVLEFYQKRNELGYCRGDSARLLSSMKELVYKEIKNAEQMISLCEKDNRIGFHSEAEGYKFFPAKLKEKIKKCEYLLKTDFKEVEERIHQGLPPLAYYLGEEVDSLKYSLKEKRYEFLSDGLSFFSILDKGEELEIELKSEKAVDFYLCAEYELFYPQTPVIIKQSGEVCIHRDGIMLQSVFDESVEIEKNKWKVKVPLEGKEKTRLLVSLKKSEVGFIGYPFKLLIKTMDGASWCTEQNPVYTLGKSKLSPAEFGWIIN